MEVSKILEERGKRYGEFIVHAEIAQNIKRAMYANNPTLSSLHREALDMIAHKMARIVNGDPYYDDNWIDIAGYATLVVNELLKMTEVSDEWHDGVQEIRKTLNSEGVDDDM